MAFSYMCRCTRTTKAYKSPKDIIPTGAIIQPGTIFISDAVITAGNIKMYSVDSAIAGSAPVGQFVVSDLLDISPVINDDEKPKEKIVTNNDETDVEEILHVTSESLKIYDSWDTTKEVKHNFYLGYTFKIDKVVSYNNGGIIEERGRISDVGEESDYAMIGKWVLLNHAISPEQSRTVYDTPAPTAPTTEEAQEAEAADNVDRTTGDNVVEGANIEETIITNLIEDVVEDINTLQTSFSELFSSYGLYGEYDSESIMSVPLGRMLFVHGMPFQYTHLTDRRANSTNTYGKEDSGYAISGKMSNGAGSDFYGRSFAKEILCNMPIVVLTPGIPRFMTNVKDSVFGYAGSSKSVKEAWIPFWSDLTDSEFESALSNLADEANGKTYQYYSMDIDTASYYEYVNAGCQTMARLMDLKDIVFWGKKCTELDWGTYNSAADQDYSAFEDIMGLNGGVSFAYDPLSSITDNMSNSTTESQLAGILNGLSAKAREIDFMGNSAGIDINALDTESYEAAIGQVADDGWFKGTRTVVSRVSAFIKNATHGLNVRFPQIWSDTSYSKSYSFDMHFITPYSTNFCKWRYVLVPFFTVFCLVAPRSDDDITSYKRPFLVRAFSRGYINVEMGMIEGLQWKRFGDGDMISEDGIPTQIDVTVDIADMYQQLAMSRFTGDYLHTVDVGRIGIFFNNTGLMDLIGTMSGVHMSRLTLGERLSLFASSAKGAFSATGSNFMRHAAGRVRNITENWFYNY